MKAERRGTWFWLLLGTLWPTVAGAQAGEWTQVTSRLSPARGLFTCELRAIAVGGGRVLVAGGVSKNPAGGRLARTEVDLFAGDQFSRAAPLAVGRSMTANVALSDGGALVAGGGTTFGLPSLDTAERWNPSTGQWTSGIPMKAKRHAATATRLKDGRVVIIGGMDGWTGVPSAEIFDPASNTTRLTTGSMGEGRIGHIPALLDDGRVYIWGGSLMAPQGQQPPLPPRTTYLFNPASEQFEAGPLASRGAAAHGGARLPDGKVIYCGGCNQGCMTASFSNCDVFTPVTGGPGSLRATGALRSGSGAQAMIALPTGQILLVGGVSSGAALSRAEIYDPATETWSLTRTQPTVARYDAGIALLRDGRVLVMGGRTGPPNNNEVFLDSAEVYDPGMARMCRIPQIDGTVDILGDGVACDDGNPATANEGCASGVCTPGARTPPPPPPADAGPPADAAGGTSGPDAQAVAPDLRPAPPPPAPDAATVADLAADLAADRGPSPDASAEPVGPAPPSPVPDAAAANPSPPPQPGVDPGPPTTSAGDAGAPPAGRAPSTPARSGGGCILAGDDGSRGATGTPILALLAAWLVARVRRKPR